MAFTQTQLDAIEEAIATGARSVVYEGKSITYASLDEMLRARALIRRALGLDKKSPTVLAAHDRGFAPGSPFEDS